MGCPQVKALACAAGVALRRRFQKNECALRGANRAAGTAGITAHLSTSGVMFSFNGLPEARTKAPAVLLDKSSRAPHRDTTIGA